ncbi:MAG: hypothetical protein ACRERC_25920, partial [Candidatus Binatia bacterium]
MTPALRCGLYVPNFGPYGDAHTLAAIAAAAEAAGWDGCFVWDHVARPRRVDLVDPWIALAAMALLLVGAHFGDRAMRTIGLLS